jgi:hypothetical protein
VPTLYFPRQALEGIVRELLRTRFGELDAAHAKRVEEVFATSGEVRTKAG